MFTKSNFILKNKQVSQNKI